mmetsp:Transcript_46212/g.108252  ORF Transcript_46212/g.108252 Transcript_46212/m.108252 type:complete len:277 (-) Transcript_46212:141-971(-)
MQARVAQTMAAGSSKGYLRMRQGDLAEQFQMQHEEYHAHSQPGYLPALLENLSLVHSESMDLQNDPRFFQINVLDKRLSAVQSLAVVSGLMTTASSHVINMRKDLNFQTTEGVLRFISFVVLCLVLYLNLLAVYVGVAQVYHTYRLETAGPTGFEIAASYYLNPNIASYRHLAVKCLLNGLPLFLFSSGIRVAMSFEVEADTNTPKMNAETAHVLCMSMMALFTLGAISLSYIHFKHMAVFRSNYEAAKFNEKPFMATVQDLLASTRRNSHHAPDV